MTRSDERVFGGLAEKLEKPGGDRAGRKRGRTQHPRRGVAHKRPRALRIWPRGDQQQHRQLRGPRREVAHEPERRLIYPLHIIDRHDDRAIPSQVRHQPEQAVAPTETHLLRLLQSLRFPADLHALVQTVVPPMPRLRPTTVRVAHHRPHRAPARTAGALPRRQTPPPARYRARRARASPPALRGHPRPPAATSSRCPPRPRPPAGRRGHRAPSAARHRLRRAPHRAREVHRLARETTPRTLARIEADPSTHHKAA